MQYSVQTNGNSPPTSHREVSDEAREIILQTIEDGITAGSSKSALAELRNQLADLLDLSRPQVRAVSAWILINADKLRNISATEQTISTRQAVEILVYLRHCSPSTFDNDVFDLSAHLGVEEDAIRKLWNAKVLDTPATDSHAMQISTEPLKATDAAEIPGHTKVAVTGSTADYDAPIKVKWRQRWMEFVKEQLTTAELKEAKVICLPSRNPRREVSGYLEMGIPAGNVTAVEGDPSAFEAFTRGCSELGVQPHCGRLKDLLPKLGTRFNIVSYDFTGQISGEALRTLQLTPISPKYCVAMANFMGKREGRSSKDLLAAWATNDGTPYPEQLATEAKKFREHAGGAAPAANGDLLKRVVAAVDANIVRNAAALEEVREENLLRAFVHTLGHADSQRIAKCISLVHNLARRLPHDYESKSKLPRWEVARSAISIFSVSALESIDRALGDIFSQPASLIAGECLGDWINGRIFCHQAVQLKYRSASGNSNSPFHTVMAKIYSPIALYERVSESAIFLARAASATVLNELTGNMYPVRFLRKSGMRSGPEIWAVQRGKVIARIPAEVLLSDIKLSITHLSEFAQRSRLRAGFDLDAEEHHRRTAMLTPGTFFQGSKE